MDMKINKKLNPLDRFLKTKEAKNTGSIKPTPQIKPVISLRFTIKMLPSCMVVDFGLTE